jgi:hypothetical protein
LRVEVRPFLARPGLAFLLHPGGDESGFGRLKDCWAAAMRSIDIWTRALAAETAVFWVSSRARMRSSMVLTRRTAASSVRRI